MEINRYNYEEYFLLYVDNELSAADRFAVDRFVEQNPDLQTELESLQQSLLNTDDNIIFPNIETLFKNESSFAINNENFEECFVLYGDNELSNENKDLVEAFVYRHPQHQATFEAILKAKLQPDTTEVFRNKEVLYKHEQSEKVFYITWLRWGVAAALIILAGLFWVNRNSFIKHAGITNNIASTEEHKKDSQSIVVLSEKTLIKQLSTHNETAGSNTLQTNKATEQLHTDAKLTTNKTRQTTISDQNTDQQTIASKTKNNDDVIKDQPTIASMEPKLNSTIVELVKDDNIQQNAIKIAGKIQDNNERTEIVKKIEPEQHTEIENNKIYFANIEPNRKNALRGFFRKAGRIIERTANVDPEEKPGILIGNFAIATK